MPKRPVYTDPAKKKAKKTEKKSVPPVPALLPPHASQAALVERVTAALGATATALLVGRKDEPGLGKTRVAGKAARDWLKRETAEGRTALAVFAREPQQPRPPPPLTIERRSPSATSPAPSPPRLRTDAAPSHSSACTQCPRAVF